MTFVTDRRREGSLESKSNHCRTGPNHRISRARNTNATGLAIRCKCVLARRSLRKSACLSLAHSRPKIHPRSVRRRASTRSLQKASVQHCAEPARRRPPQHFKCSLAWNVRKTVEKPGLALDKARRSYRYEALIDLQSCPQIARILKVVDQHCTQPPMELGSCRDQPLPQVG